jgi:hypothetical protein
LGGAVGVLDAPADRALSTCLQPTGEFGGHPVEATLAQVGRAFRDWNARRTWATGSSRLLPIPM